MDLGTQRTPGSDVGTHLRRFEGANAENRVEPLILVKGAGGVAPLRPIAYSVKDVHTYILYVPIAWDGTYP